MGFEHNHLAPTSVFLPYALPPWIRHHLRCLRSFESVQPIGKTSSSRFVFSISHWVFAIFVRFQEKAISVCQSKRENCHKSFWRLPFWPRLWLLSFSFPQTSAGRVTVVAHPQRRIVSQGRGRQCDTGLGGNRWACFSFSALFALLFWGVTLKPGARKKSFLFPPAVLLLF